MCLAVPAQIIELCENDTAKVKVGGVVQTVSVTLIEEPRVGDYVIVHVGYALNKLDEKSALETLEHFRELEALCEPAGNSESEE